MPAARALVICCVLPRRMAGGPQESYRVLLAWELMEQLIMLAIDVRRNIRRAPGDSGNQGAMPAHSPRGDQRTGTLPVLAMT